jgi:hypothetical protein
MNECGLEVPSEIEAEAVRLRCAKGVKYVYRDGAYGRKGPAASIGCLKASRFRSGDHDPFKVDLGDGWVAFRSPSVLAVTAEPVQLLDQELPPLPVSRIGKITRRRKIDGTPLVFRVDDQELFVAPSNRRKAYLLQKIRMDDGEGFEKGHWEYRIAYYMIGHKDRVKGRWAFGQFAPIMTPENLAAIVQRLQQKGWLVDRSTVCSL